MIFFCPKFKIRMVCERSSRNSSVQAYILTIQYYYKKVKTDHPIKSVTKLISRGGSPKFAPPPSK